MFWIRGLAVERSLHMRKVDGSTPSGSTSNISSMKILFFCRLFYPHIGGVEKHVFEISRILVKKGHEVVVVTEQHDKNLSLHEKIGNIEVWRIPNLKENWFKKFKIWKWILRHKDLIKLSDVVHCHDVFFWFLPFIFLYSQKKVYTTFHGYEDYPISKKAVLVRRVSEKLSKGNICVGDFMKKWYGTNPTLTTYGGIDMTNFKDKISNIKNNSALFIGRLDEQTGIKTYIESIKIIRKEIPNFKLLVIGEGKFNQDIGIEIKVLKFQKRVGKFFQQYHFAFVSRYLAILEAMASKRLVFAIYDNPLKKDYLRMAPFSKFINIAKTPKELASLIFYYLENLEKEKTMINNAFQWVKFQSWNKVARLYLNLWKKE